MKLRNAFYVLRLLKAQSIKTKLNFAFLAFFVLVLMVFAAFYRYDLRQSRIHKITNKIKEINTHIYLAQLAEKDFFLYESINPNFYQSNKSLYLQEHKQLFSRVQKDLKSLKNSNELNNQILSQKIDSLFFQIQASENLFERLVAVIKKRGFKDYGLEGKMRKVIHQIENAAYPLSLSKILMIRRHEKDFFLRKEESYLKKLNEAFASLEAEIKLLNIPKTESQKIQQQLILYKVTFYQIVDAEKEIGFKTNSGLKGKMNSISSDIDRRIRSINEIVLTNAQTIQRNLKLAMALLCLLFLGILLFLSFFISQKLGKPIKDLSQSIYQVIAHDFKGEIKLTTVHKRDEVGSLSRDFMYMIGKMKAHTEKILKQKEEISAQRDMLHEQNNEILEVQQKLEETNEELQALNSNLEHIVEERTSKLTQINEELDLFVYRASHDLKGPIARLRGLTHLGKMEIQEEIAYDYFDKMEHNVRDMDGLLDKLLMINVIHQEVRRYRKTKFSDIWENIEKTLHPFINQKNVFVAAYYDEERFFFSDQTLLQIIIQNLVENAIIFSNSQADKPAFVHVDLKCEKSFIKIYVEDNGIGIPKEVQPKIANMFFRGSELSHGNGLGLYIVQKALEELEGTLEVNSEVGRFSIFTVHIPHRNQKKKVIDFD